MTDGGSLDERSRVIVSKTSHFCLAGGSPLSGVWCSDRLLVSIRNLRLLLSSLLLNPLLAAVMPSERD